MTDLTRRRLIGVVAVIAALSALAALSMVNLGDSLVYYWSPTELKEKLGKQGAEADQVTVRLGGLVVPGSFDLAKCDPGCTFRITDGTSEVTVVTAGLPPQMFREGIGVVVEGEFEGEQFHTDRVMVKHNNEYRAPEHGEKPDIGTLTEGGT